MGTKGTKARRSLSQPRKHHHYEKPNKLIKRAGLQRRQHSQSIGRALEHKSQSADGSTVKENGQAATSLTSGIGNGHRNNSNTVKIPFKSHDHILLVGEGDFSFTESLVSHHNIHSITTTCFDSQQVLEEKYPGVKDRIHKLTGLSDWIRGGARSEKTNAPESEWNGFSPSPVANDDENDGSHDRYQSDDDKNGTAAIKKSDVAILYGIDATKLSSVHRKTLKPRSPFSKIVFNFPHVGGLSKDVNRQVRSNQELLVGFFNAAKPLLATADAPITSKQPLHKSDVYSTSDEEEEVHKEPSIPSKTTAGYILVTLFEGEPYTLWNIRDLARHCGLKVVESFKFLWTAYPGYKHARTLGDITTGKDRTKEGRRKGAWRGEEREARCYVLALKEAEGPYPAAGSGKKRKRSGDNDDDVSE